MISDKQLEANRANAQLSTGPRTEEGKTRSSRNAFQHGLRAASYRACLDDPTAFDDLCAELVAIHQPGNLVEEIYVERMAISLAKQARLDQLEFAAGADEKKLATLSQYQQRLERSFDHSLRILDQLQQGAMAARQSAEAEEAKKINEMIDNAIAEEDDALHSIAHRCISEMAAGKRPTDESA